MSYYSLVFLGISVCSCAVFDIETKLEGNTVGLASNCPGSEKISYITKYSLKKLAFSIRGEGGFMASRRKSYNYYNIRSLVKDQDFSFKRKTLIYVGGYMDNPSFPFGPTIMKAYKELGYNTLMLDTFFFTVRQYAQACRYMRPVGLHAAEMLANLTQLGLDPKTVEFVGLSLGAHTASFIANRYKEITGLTFARITGLDPAGPCFRNLGLEERLDASDADFVDFVGTNIDGMGSAMPAGHVNFYVNGGENQPGDTDFWMVCQMFCSHSRAFTLWLSAIQHPYKFIAIKCNSVQQARMSDCYSEYPMETNVMGLYTDKNNTGIFYLATDHKYPYFVGENGLRKESEFWTNRLADLNKNDVVWL